MLQPKKPVVKKTTKKKSINPADSYPDKKDKRGFPLIGGGEGKRPPFKSGGKVTKAKNGKSFPDLNKDGKVTRADILKGRGVIAKNGKPVKKAAIGALLPLAMKAAPMVAGMFGGKGKKGGMGGVGGILGGLLGGKNGKTVKKSRSGGSMKTCKGGC
jgi:hypothetical protein